MPTTTIEGRLDEVARRIDRLSADIQAGTTEVKSQIERQLAALRQKEASARAAVREAYEQGREAEHDVAAAVEQRLRRLELELELAETSLKAELADTKKAVLDAGQAELDLYDAYVDHLQVAAATKVGHARSQAEDALREVRRRWSEYALRIAELRKAPGERWDELKRGADAARARLARAIDEASASLADVESVEPVRKESKEMTQQQLPEQTRAGAQAPERWEPLQDLELVVDRMRRMLDQTFVGLSSWPAVRAAGDMWSPPVDIEETDDAYLLEAEVPGVERKDVDVELVGNELTITGEAKEKERNGVVRRRSRRSGRFEYRITLPDRLDADKVEASLAGGVLTVRVPKSERPQRRKIELKAS